MILWWDIPIQIIQTKKGSRILYNLITTLVITQKVSRKYVTCFVLNSLIEIFSMKLFFYIVNYFVVISNCPIILKFQTRRISMQV